MLQDFRVTVTPIRNDWVDATTDLFDVTLIMVLIYGGFALWMHVERVYF
jgi:hypothetical protein